MRTFGELYVWEPRFSYTTGVVWDGTDRTKNMLEAAGMGIQELIQQQSALLCMRTLKRTRLLLVQMTAQRSIQSPLSQGLVGRSLGKRGGLWWI